MRLIDRQSGLEVLSRDECYRLLVDREVGRLAVVVGGRPHIFPVNYVVDGEAIVFRTDPGTKLEGAERAAVAFEIDEFDPDTRTGWSVVVHGTADEMTTFDGPFRQASRRSLGVDPWAGGDKLHWIRIRPSVVTGRRIGSPR